MENIQMIIELLDISLDTPRKRHLVGGILLSVSLLFGGLAFTSFTLKEERNNGRNNGNLRKSGNGWTGKHYTNPADKTEQYDYDEETRYGESSYSLSD